MKLTAGGHLAFFLPGRKSPVEVFVQSPDAIDDGADRCGHPIGGGEPGSGEWPRGGAARGRGGG